MQKSSVKRDPKKEGHKVRATGQENTGKERETNNDDPSRPHIRYTKNSDEHEEVAGVHT